MSVTQDPWSSYFLSISSCYSPNCIKDLTLQESDHEIMVIGEHCLCSGRISEGLTLILNAETRASCLGLAGWGAEDAENSHWRYKQQHRVPGKRREVTSWRRLAQEWKTLFSTNDIKVQSKSAFPSPKHPLNVLCEPREKTFVEHTSLNHRNPSNHKFYSGRFSIMPLIMESCLPECWQASILSRTLQMVIRWSLGRGWGGFFSPFLFFPQGETACAATKVVTSVQSATFPEASH